MKKIIRLTENDLIRLVKRVISEQTSNQYLFPAVDTGQPLQKTIDVMAGDVINLVFPNPTQIGNKFIQDYVINSARQFNPQDKGLSPEQRRQMTINMSFRYDNTKGNWNQNIMTEFKKAFAVKSIQLVGKQITFKNFEGKPVQCILDIVYPNDITINSNIGGI